MSADKSEDKSVEVNDIDLMSEEEVEKQIKEKLPGIQKLMEDVFREQVVRDFNSLARLAIANQQFSQLSNKNFSIIAEWMKKMDERMKSVEAKLEGLEVLAKNDDPKNKRIHYLQ
ncbi:MAG TPA: hypothetical protein VEP90_10210 [Methylomirabilota bacterium]|nr:hypothetical protein [Methylomirabilota bacterium]